MSDPRYQVYPNCAGDSYALTAKVEDQTVVLRKFEPSDPNQTWHRDENKEKGTFALVNRHINQAVKAPDKQGQPLRLVSVEGKSKESLPQWREVGLSDGFVSVKPVSNPTDMCWTAFDDNGVDDAVVGYKKFEQGKGNQEWKFKSF
ncbi:hypothetical protein SLEP1_g54874 [Rubroshorea leprosula]|uniref:Ricin B lectin domain-containing protein n=1 Tax=Rubroshorea leprosula TaxID=152421 RepID=A0AAV5ME13_9ROSI|nr:hypothetical protein SLEP1_g54874 [Rubroshorea leprosula]